MKVKKRKGYPNIRELSMEEAAMVTGGGGMASEEGCSDRCYDGPGCDCQPEGSPDSGKAGYNLGLALMNWLIVP